MLDQARDTIKEMAKIETADFLRIGVLTDLIHSEVAGALALVLVTFLLLLLDRAICTAWRKHKRKKEAKAKRDARAEENLYERLVG